MSPRNRNETDLRLAMYLGILPPAIDRLPARGLAKILRYFRWRKRRVQLRSSRVRILEDENTMAIRLVAYNGAPAVTRFVADA